jgi:hypothetical protein
LTMALQCVHEDRSVASGTPRYSKSSEQSAENQDTSTASKSREVMGTMVIAYSFAAS